MISFEFLEPIKVYLPMILSVPGALIYRARGGKPNIPRPIEQLMYSLPFALLAYVGISSFVLDLIDLKYAREIIALLVWILTTVTVLKGHGRNMDLGTWDRPAKYEWYEFTIKHLEKKLSPYWYDVIGMAVSGVTYAIPVTVATLNPLCLIVGILKAPAYMISWKITKSTEGGEWLTGGFQWALLGFLIALYI